MIDTLKMVTIALDGLGAAVSLLAAVTYIRLLFALRVADSVKLNSRALRAWLRINAIFAVIITANMLRWFVLNSAYPLLGRPTVAPTPADDMIQAACSLLMVMMPVLLVAHISIVRTALIRKESKTNG